MTKPSASRVASRYVEARFQAPRVLWHGTKHKGLRTLKPVDGAPLWLAFSPHIAAEYAASGHRVDPKKGMRGELWRVTLKNSAHIVDLSDLSDPVTRAVFDLWQVQEEPITESDWVSLMSSPMGWSQIEFSSTEDWLKERVDGYTLGDSVGPVHHRSVAIFDASAIRSAEPMAPEDAFRRASRTASRPEYGYHATFLHNLDSIASSGLRPSGGSQFGGGYSGHSRGRVFLSEWDGVSFWMSKMEPIAHDNSEFNKEDDFGWTPISLRVDIDGLEGELSDDELGRRDSGQSAAWYVEETIDPDFIEVWDGSRWVPVRSADPDTMMDQSRDAATYDSDDGEEYDEWGEPTGWWEVDFDVFMPGRG